MAKKRCRVSNEDVLRVACLVRCGWYHKDIANETGVSLRTVDEIGAGRRYQELTGLKKPEKQISNHRERVPSHYQRMEIVETAVEIV